MEYQISPVPPFNFDLTADIFKEGNPHIRKYQDNTFWQVIKPNGRPVLVSMHGTGTVDDPKIIVRFNFGEALIDRDLNESMELIRSLFSMDLNLQPFYDVLKGDHVMLRIANLLKGLRNPTSPTVFEALIDSIIEQQISLNAAWSLQTRLIESFGEEIFLGDKNFFAFPEPDILAAASIEELRKCGLSTRKAEYIRDLSQLIKSGLDVEKLKDIPDSDLIIDELRRIRGVGIWTAELTMVRGMHMIDTIPADDLGLRRCVSHYYFGDKKISGDMVRKVAESWKGWRGIACFYLLMAEKLVL
jgi:DNA-3-methyladenine glycosylase II